MAFAKLKAEIETPRRAGDLNFGGLSHLLGFNLGLALSAITRDYWVAMKDMDLTQKQFTVLTLVGANPGVSQIDLAATLGTDRATMMAIVDRLQNRGYLERAPSKIDRRRQELYLTSLGETTRAEADAICVQHEVSFRERFTPEELGSLFEMLQRLHHSPTADQG